MILEPRRRGIGGYIFQYLSNITERMGHLQSLHESVNDPHVIGLSSLT